VFHVGQLSAANLAFTATFLYPWRENPTRPVFEIWELCCTLTVSNENLRFPPVFLTHRINDRLGHLPIGHQKKEMGKHPGRRTHLCSVCYGMDRYRLLDNKIVPAASSLLRIIHSTTSRFGTKPSQATNNSKNTPTNTRTISAGNQANSAKKRQNRRGGHVARPFL
jgi:hypothetical protein